MEEARKEEISYMVESNVLERVPFSRFARKHDIQPLHLVLQTERSHNGNSSVQYRAGLVSA